MTATALQEIDVALPRRSWPRYPDYRSTGAAWLAEMPTHWTIKRLRYVVGFPNKGEVRCLPLDTAVSFVPMEAVGEYGGLLLDQVRPIEEVLNGYTFFRDGDVIVAKITPCFENGKGALAQGLENGVGFGTTELHVLRAGAEILPKYLFYLTLGEHFRKLGTAEMYGAGGQKRVPERFLQNLRHPLPPLDEQRAIVAFLDRETAHIDRLIAAKERLIGLLQEKRAALVERVVSTVSTQLVKLRRALVQRPKNGISPPPGNEGEGVPTFSIAAVRDGSIDILGNLKSASISLTGATPYLVRRGDILVVRGNANQSLVGTCGMVSEHPENCVYPDLLIRIVPCPRVYPRYLVLILNSGIVRSQIESIARTSNGTLKISGEDVCSLQVPIPEPNVQSEILRSVDCESEELVSLSNAVKRHISLLQTLRANLITAAVTGQIDVRNYEEEAACP
jgi:type I restriction enzyme S subunit